MTIENQVVDIELSEIIQKLRLCEDGIFAYYNNPYHGTISPRRIVLEYKKDGYDLKEYLCSTYTVAELAEQLLPDIVYGSNSFGDYACWSESNLLNIKEVIVDKKLANCLAKMLIYLRTII